MTAPRHHICDVPGCTRERKRWQRICDSCWPQLPGDIRHGITENHRLAARAPQGSLDRARARKAHRDFCREARAHLDRAAATAFERNARRMGERD